MQMTRTDRVWKEPVKEMIKGELKRWGFTHAQLVGKLADTGIMNFEANIRNKLAWD